MCPPGGVAWLFSLKTKHVKTSAWTPVGRVTNDTVGLPSDRPPPTSVGLSCRIVPAVLLMRKSRHEL